MVAQWLVASRLTTTKFFYNQESTGIVQCAFHFFVPFVNPQPKKVSTFGTIPVSFTKSNFSVTFCCIVLVLSSSFRWKWGGKKKYTAEDQHQKRVLINLKNLECVLIRYIFTISLTALFKIRGDLNISQRQTEGFGSYLSRISTPFKTKFSIK